MANRESYPTVAAGWRSGDTSFTVGGHVWRSATPGEQDTKEEQDGPRGLATGYRKYQQRYFGARLDAILKCE